MTPEEQRCEARGDLDSARAAAATAPPATPDLVQFLRDMGAPFPTRPAVRRKAS